MQANNDQTSVWAFINFVTGVFGKHPEYFYGQLEKSLKKIFRQNKQDNQQYANITDIQEPWIHRRDSHKNINKKRDQDSEAQRSRERNIKYFDETTETEEPSVRMTESQTNIKK